MVTLNSSCHICVDEAADCLDSGLDMNYIINYNHGFLGCDAVYLGQIPNDHDHALNIQHRTNIKYCNENLPLDLFTEFLGQTHTFTDSFMNLRVCTTPRA
jgi:hypothetical protein